MNHISADAGRWVVIPRPRPAATIRLVCFSHAGGGAASYAQWPGLLPESVEVCAVQLPARESRIREGAIASVPDLVPRIVSTLLPWLDRPFAFYGHSMGSIVAFETARALRRAGGPGPEVLLVGASRAPQRPWPFPSIRHLEETAFLDAVHARYGTVPALFRDDPELRSLVTPGLRGDFSIVETYQHEAEAPFSIPIHVFGGVQDTSVARSDLDAWREQTTGPTRVMMMPGGHLFHLEARAPLLAEVQATLAGLLAPQGDRR